MVQIIKLPASNKEAVIVDMQSLQAIKLLTTKPAKKVQINQLNLLDGLANQWQQFNMKKQANCTVCGSNN